MNSTLEYLFAEGTQLHQAGMLDEAESRYLRITEALPQAAPVWHALGILNFQRGNSVLAVSHLKRAISLAPGEAEFHNNLGLMLHELKQFQEAESELRQAIALRSNYPEAYNNLGNTLKEVGSFEDACQAYRIAIQIHPEFSGAYNNLGVANQKLGLWSESVRAIRQAIQLQPGDASAYYNLGLSLAKCDDFLGAMAAYRQAITLDPSDVVACKNLSKILLDQGEWQQALACLEHALSKKPEFADAWIDKGIVHGQLGDSAKAEFAFKEALRWKPISVEANYNLGILRLGANDYENARLYLTRADELQPGSVDVELLRIAQYQCDWDAIPQLVDRVLNQATQADSNDSDSLSPFVFITLPEETSSKAQDKVARRWSKRYRQHSIGIKNQQPSTRITKSRLRIGYVSADFHDHATGWLIAELIESHNRSQFDIFGYSNGPDDGSETRRRFAKAFDKFCDIRPMSYAAAAQSIADDAIDILVDLKGFTENNRAEIFALRPAPIQVSYLGYPGTMGADFIDYLLVDTFIVPSDRQTYYCEKLVYLPGCYQVNDATLGRSVVPTSRHACGLQDNAIVCCSFNSSYKLTPDTFQLWLEILRNAPTAILWLLEQSPQASRNLKRIAEQSGVDPNRLVFAPMVRHDAHLGRLAVADLFLDSFPVTAHTTASDALRMGVPLLTRIGESFVTRVAGSLLHSLGLDELIATSSDEYLRKALELTRSRQRLLEMRQLVETRVSESDLWDGRSFARKIEQAYLSIWNGHV